MTKIKIVIVGEYPLSKILCTGYHFCIARLSHYLSRIKGIELHIIKLGKENRQFKKDNLIVHEVKRLFNLPYAFTIPIDTWFLRREILKVKPDIVDGMGAEAYSLAPLLVRNKYPVVLTMLGVRGKESRFGGAIYSILGLIVLNPLEKYIVSKMPNIVVETPSIKNMISKGTNSKIYVVQDGIELEKINGFPLHKGEKPDVLFVSRLVKLKGADVLIKALPMVLNSIPDLSVYIAGTGPQEDELRNLVKELKLGAHVKFLGFISDEEEKYSYYKACKIVVAPSRWDCQPYAVTEGAACGKPIIASDKSNPALLDDGKIGFIFQSENVEDLANKIIKLLKDERLREEMGKAAMEKAKEYDWSKIADRKMEIYKTVIADFHGLKRRIKNKRKNREYLYNVDKKV